MKNLKMIISQIVIIALLLAACGKGETNTAELNSMKAEQESTVIANSESQTSETVSNKGSGGETESESESSVTTTPESLRGNLVELSGSGIYKISEGGTYILKGTLEGQVEINTSEDITLKLAGVSIQSVSGPAINIQSARQVTIEIVEGTDNKLADVPSVEEDIPGGALYSSVDMEILGNGNLEVIGTYKHAISSDGNLTIHEGNIKVSAVKDGIHADKDLVIQDGNIQVVTSNEGLESKSGLYINGGNIELQSEDDGLNAATLIEINGGKLFGIAGGDGIDSNGDLVVNGGTVLVFAANTDNGPVDVGDDGGQFVINGGTIFLSGGPMGIEVSSSSKQPSLWIGTNIEAGNTVEIRGTEEQSLNQYEVENSASLAFYSSNELQINETYEVLVDGVSVGSTQLSSYSETIERGSGMMGPMEPGGENKPRGF